MAETTTKVKYEGPTGIVANRKEFSYSSTYTCIDEDNNIVEVVAVSRCKDGRDIYHSTKFDFSDFERGELLELAARPSIISARTPEFRTRNSSEAIEALEGKTLNAKDYFKREKKSKSFEQKVQDLVDQGVPAEAAELMLKDPVAFYKSLAVASKS